MSGWKGLYMMLHRRGDGWLSEKPNVAPYTYAEGPSEAIFSTAVVLTAIATIFVSIRIYTRLSVYKSRHTWSLLFAALSWTLCVPTSILWAVSARWGFGRSFKEVESWPNIDRALLFVWIGAVLNLFATWFGKLAALLYILDVQGPTHRRGRWLLISLVTINFVLYIILIPFFFLQCTPISQLWHPSVDNTCLEGPRLFIVATTVGTWGACTDLVLAVYPMALIWKLQIKQRLKVGLCMLLGLGIFSAVCAILKTMMFCAFQATRDAWGEVDPTVDNAGFVYWSLVEMWVILIVGSVPPLWPVGKLAATSAYASLTSSWRRSGSALGRRSKRLGDTSTYGVSGIYASAAGSETERKTAAKRYFYEYGVPLARDQTVEEPKTGSFGEWGVIVTRQHSNERLATSDGIVVTRDISVSTESADERAPSSEKAR